MTNSKVFCGYCACWLLCFGLTSGNCIAQEQSQPDPTEVSSERQPSVERAIAAINQLKLVEKKYYDPGLTKFHLDEALSLIELRREYNEIVAAKLQERLAFAEAELNNLANELATAEANAAESTGTTIPSQETLEQLNRNCLIEKQRLEWELAAESAISEAEARTTFMDLKVQRTLIESQQIEIEGIKEKLMAAMEAFEQSKKMVENGLAPTTDIQQAELSLKDLQTRLNIALKGLEASTIDIETRHQRSLEEGALRRQTLADRSEAIDSQSTRIADQSKWASTIARIKAKMAKEERVMMTVKQAALQYEIEQISYQALHGMLKQALEKAESLK